MRNVLRLTLGVLVVLLQQQAVAQQQSTSPHDADGDSLADSADNCPCVPNPDQKDTDDDGIGDACDATPSVSNLPSPAAAANDLDDGDGVPTETDNCPEKANPNQRDSDDDGVGDACDNCVCAKNPPPEQLTGSASDTRQKDEDNDGIGDECDVCPLPNASETSETPEGNLVCEQGRATLWQDPSKTYTPKDDVQFFFRPAYAIYHAPGGWQSTTGINLYASGSVDSWSYTTGDIVGAAAQPMFANPPAWYWRAGIYVDPVLTEQATAGLMGSVDWRPEAWRDVTFLSMATIGLQLHFLYVTKARSLDMNAALIGLGLKLGVFDLVSLVPFAQLDVAQPIALQGGGMIVFDLAVLEQLGVKDRIPLARKLLWEQ